MFSLTPRIEKARALLTQPIAEGQITIANVITRTIFLILLIFSVIVVIAGASSRIAESTGECLHQGVTLPALTCGRIVTGLEIAAGLASCAFAVFIVARLPSTPMTWLIALFFLALSTGQTNMADTLLKLDSHKALWAVFSLPIFVLRAGSTALYLPIMCLAPNGRFVPRWTRLVCGVVLFIHLIWLLFPSLPFNGIYGSVRQDMAELIYVVSLAWSAAGIYAMFYRFRHSSSAVERQQVKWLAVGLVTMVVGGLAYYGIQVVENLYIFLSGDVYIFGRSIIQLLLIFLVPIFCITIAVVTYRVWLIDVLIQRTLLTILLTAVLLMLYFISVYLISTIFQSDTNTWSSLVAAGVVVIAFQPIRLWLDQQTNRLIFGRRDDPLSILNTLSRQLELSIASESILNTITETIADALRLPFVAIEIRDGEKAKVKASSGQMVGELLRLPLIYQAEVIGNLVVSARGGGERLNSADWSVLQNVAKQISVAVHGVRATTDLIESRQRIVTTREEERRRLRRDLHDGLGPAFASLANQADIARTVLLNNPARATELLQEIADRSRTSLIEMRRLVYGLRPPALDELGLNAALRQQIEQIITPPLEIQVALPDPLPPLPAALEVAIYFIVCEALTNAARYAQATRIEISLLIGQNMQLEIIDDGVGMPDSTRTGVGLNAMYERAAELGGRCIVRSIPTQGTTIQVVIPMFYEELSNA